MSKLRTLGRQEEDVQNSLTDNSSGGINEIDLACVNNLIVECICSVSSTAQEGEEGERRRDSHGQPSTSVSEREANLL